MTYELRLERQYDASPEEVFDTFSENTSQGVLTAPNSTDGTSR